MGYYREFDPESRFLRIRFHGHVTDRLLTDVYREARSLMISTNAVSGIFDFTEVMSVGVSAKTIRTLADLPPIVIDPIPRAVVAEGDCTYGLARMFQMLGGDTRHELYIVRTPAEAYEILGLGSPDFKVLSAA